MKKIDSYESFIQEFVVLFDEINKNINDLAQYNRVEMEKPSVAIAEKLNRLKIQRKKVQEMLRRYKEMDTDNWVYVREEAQKVFEDARREWLKISEEVKYS